MVHHLTRTLAMLVCIAACSHSDAAARRTSSAAPATDAVPAAPKPMPHDSISDLADRGRIMGDSSAKVWVIMASDFQCPYCKEWHDKAFQNVVKTYVNTGKVRLAFLNMPLSMHPNAVPAAEAAMCASVQNKFWPMHEALFATQTSWGELPDPHAKFDSIATSLGVKMGEWRDCVAQHLTLALIQADHDRARSANVNSTPTFFVGNQTISSADADVPAAIETALKAAGNKP